MIQRAFDRIGKEDIDPLIADGVPEGKTLEYKQTLPGQTDGEKKEFLADVSSFANASGGDIIYGLSAAVDAEGEKTGAPGKVCPMEGETLDQAKERLEHMIRNGIDPRPRVQVKEIRGWGADGNSFLVLVRIRQSFASPHMVTYRGHGASICAVLRASSNWTFARSGRHSSQRNRKASGSAASYRTGWARSWPMRRPMAP